MSDRFRFLEIDDAPHPPPALETEETPTPGFVPAADMNRLRVKEVIGEMGTGTGQFRKPGTLTVDRYGVLYACDTDNHRVQRIAPNGDVLCYGGPGTGVGQLFGPAGVAVHPSGQFIYVSDQGNNRINCYRMDTSPAGFMSGFHSPAGMAFDPAGYLWVADPGGGRIVRLDVAANRIIGELRNGLLRPISVCFDAQGALYALDAQHSALLRYRGSATPHSALSDIHRPRDGRQAAVDREGRIYLAEAGADRLHIFAPDGNSLLIMQETGTKLGALSGPGGVAVEMGGSIYVSDTNNHRILRIQPE